MDPASLLLAIALPSIPARSWEYDIDAPMKAAMVDLNSPEFNAHVLAAMAWPYRYGVTQMPCKATALQPEREWHPAREPAGRIQWVEGPVTRVFWSGIYGTCLIQAPAGRDEIRENERIPLECECNGWLPGK